MAFRWGRTPRNATEGVPYNASIELLAAIETPPMTDAILRAVQQDQLKTDLPDLHVGDTVDVHVKIIEGAKERIQVFTGVIIKMQGGGSQIILATDRPISIKEAMRGGQSTDYNTSLIVLNIPASGAGNGMLAAAVALSVGENGKIEPQTAGQGATKLGDVKVKEKK